jgi:hypothetical protein
MSRAMTGRTSSRAGAACRIAAIGCVLWACSVGQGTGSAHGAVRIPNCRLDNPSYELRPSFFVADFVEDPRTTSGLSRRIVQMRIQRGSYSEQASDGINVLVRDVDAIAAELGTAIPVGTDQPVSMTLYLGESCPAGLPEGDYFTLPTFLSATSGTITFDSIYAPDVAPDALQISAHFVDVRFEDAVSPATRFAHLDGEFAFFYQRGRPAQHFP